MPSERSTRERPPSERLTLRELAARVGLVVGSLAVALLALEVGIRAYHGRAALADWHNPYLYVAGPEQPWGGVVTDRALGFVMLPDFASPRTNHDSAGFRIVRGAVVDERAAKEPPILAVGDSYVYGAAVDDASAWPALLQPIVGRRVINAAVVGFGLDQMVLRLEALVPALRPAVAIVGFIPDDVRRLGLSRAWGGGKPYFVLEGEPAAQRLALRNVPVPSPPPREQMISTLHRLFGWSYLLHAFERRLMSRRDEWIGESLRVMPREAAEQIVCPLMARAARIGVPLLVVAQYEPGGWSGGTDGEVNRREQQRVTALVLGCAATAGIATLDLFAETDRAVRDMGFDAMFDGSHPSAESNRITADAVATELRRRGWLDPR